MLPTQILCFFRKIFKKVDSQKESPLEMKRLNLSEKLSKRRANVVGGGDALKDSLCNKQTEALSHWNVNRHEAKGPICSIEDRPARKSAFSIDPGFPSESNQISRTSEIQIRTREAQLRNNEAQMWTSEALLWSNAEQLPTCEDQCLTSESHLLSEEGQVSKKNSKVACELCETAFADEWDSQQDSLFAKSAENPVTNSTPVAQKKTENPTFEYEEDYDEELLPYFTETLLLYEDDEPADRSLDLVKTYSSSSRNDVTAEEESLSSMADRVEIQTMNQAAVEELAAEDVAHALKTPPQCFDKEEEASEKIAAVGDETITAPQVPPAVEQPYKNFSDNALKLIGQKPETPAATLIWLASHANPHVRAAVARNTSTPGDTIIVLSKDHEAGIRHSIAENRCSPVQALQLLIRDRNPLIAWRAQQTLNLIKDVESKANQKSKQTSDTSGPTVQQPARKHTHAPMNEEQKQKPLSIEVHSDEQRCSDHHKVKVHSPECEFAKKKNEQSEETVAFLQLIARKTNTPNRRLAELAVNTDVRIRAAVGENANAPSDILWLLAKDPDSTVKLKLIDNYNCPLEILEALREDQDEYVAYQAHAALMKIIGACADNHIRTVTWP